MRIRNKKLLALVLTVCLVLTQMVFATSVFAADSKDRLAGADRYSTAIAIAQAGWTTSQYAVLARGDDEGGGADALGAAPLAAKYKAPILLTEPAALTDGVLQELKGLGVKNVFIAGGTGAVSAAVEKTLTDNGMTVTRFAGTDRFETAYKIAVAEFPTATGVALVYAYNFADALSISSFAAANGMPILLASNDYVPTAEKAYIADKQIYAVGGNGVISDALFAGLKNATRYAGLDRYETNAAVLSKLTFNYDVVYVATGENFPDALAGSALAAAKGAPIVLFDPVNLQYAQAAANNVKGTTQVVALGGLSVVPQIVVDDLKAEVAKKAAADAAKAKADAVKAAVDAITALPAVDAVKLTDEAAVVAAKALVDEAKAKGAVDADITNLAKLTDLTAKIADLKKAEADKAAAIKAAIDAIAALPAADKLTLADADAVAAARALVTDAIKADVTNLDVLEDAEAQIAYLQADPFDHVAVTTILPGVYQAKVYLKAGASTTGLTVKVDGNTAVLNAGGYYVAAAASATPKVEITKSELVAKDGVVADTKVTTILPGVYQAKVYLNAGVSTTNLTVKVDGNTAVLNANGYFVAAAASDTPVVEVFVVNSTVWND